MERPDDEDDAGLAGRKRVVIDLRTPPGALSRSALRQLREELGREVYAHESEPAEFEPADPRPADPRPADPGVRARPRARARSERTEPTAERDARGTGRLAGRASAQRARDLVRGTAPTDDRESQPRDTDTGSLRSRPAGSRSSQSRTPTSRRTEGETAGTPGSRSARSEIRPEPRPSPYAESASRTPAYQVPEPAPELPRSLPPSPQRRGRVATEGRGREVVSPSAPAPHAWSGRPQPPSGDGAEPGRHRDPDLDPDWDPVLDADLAEIEADLDAELDASLDPGTYDGPADHFAERPLRDDRPPYDDRFDGRPHGPVPARGRPAATPDPAPRRRPAPSPQPAARRPGPSPQPPPARRPDPATMHLAESPWPSRQPDERRGPQDRPVDRAPRPPVDRARRPSGGSGGRRPGRPSWGLTSEPSSPRVRPALLIRTTVVIGIIAAIAASLNRVGQQPPTGDGAGQAASAVTGQIVPGQGKQPSPVTTTAPVVPPPANSGPASAANTGQASGQDGTTCRVSYNVTLDSATQYTVVLSVANTGTSKVGGWVLRWQYPTTQKVLYGWNAMVTNGPNGIAASGIGQGQTITPGHHVTIGFVGQRGQQVPTPTGFTLNGQPCAAQPLPGNATVGTNA